ncbi:MAG: class I SAM-dependent methyltransferase [Conexibacter sp.]
MPDWQQRITRATAPSIRVEHELRYAAAAPLVHASALWCDLGCGTGLAAAATLGRPFEGTAVLVDRDEDAVREAQQAIEARELVALTADLADRAELERLRARLDAAAPQGRRTVTCFETLEHLASFAPLAALLVELARQDDCTVVLSVPNDAFWAIENPHHATAWGDGAVAELRSLLPADHVLVHQVALQGSALVRPGETASEVASVALADGEPSHFLIAFGAAADQLAAAPRVVQADLAAQRRWERQRDSDLAYAEARVEQLEAIATPPAAGAGGDAA